MRPLFIIILAIGATTCSLAQDDKAKESVTYKDHVAPILRKHCGNCHNADDAKSDLNLMNYQALVAGGSSGPAISPGSPDQSRLYRLISHQEEPAMPPKRAKLAEEDLALIAKWIERGAPDTAVSAALISSRKTEMDPSVVATDKPDGKGAMPETLPTLALPKTLRAAAITALDASPWAPLIAASGHECVLLYNTEDHQRLGALAFPEGVIHALRFSRNGELLLVAGGKGAEQGLVVLFDVRSGKRVAEIGEEPDSVIAADISPDLSLVALGGPDKLVKVFSVATGKQLYQIKKHTDWITAIEFSPDGNFLLSGDRNGGAFVWEAKTGGIVYTLGDHKEMITQVSWRADSQVFATASEDGRVILWYTEDGFPVRSVNAQMNANAPNPNPKQKLPGVLSVKFSRNGDFASVGRDSSARIWSNSGSRNDATFIGFKQIPTRACLNHDGQHLIVGDLTGTIRVWDIKQKMLLAEFATNADPTDVIAP